MLAQQGRADQAPAGGVRHHRSLAGHRDVSQLAPAERVEVRGYRIAIWLGLIGAGGNVTVALLPLYRVDAGLSSGTVTGLFGLYALSLIPALPIGGMLVDRLGPRSLLVPVSLATIVTSAIFTVGGHSLATLVVARLMQGLVSGAAFTTGTALLSSDGTTRGRGGRTTAVAMTGGFAIGALVGGFLGQWGPAPTALPYLVHIAAVLLSMALIRAECANLRRSRAGATLVAAARRRPALLRTGALNEAVWFLAPCAVCIYGFPAIAISAVPALVGVPGPPVAGTGILAAMTLGSGAAVAGFQRILGRWTAAVSASLGMTGATLIAISTFDSLNRVVLLVAAVLLGCGGGLALAHILVRLPALTRYGRLGTVSAIFYMVAYTGFGLPFGLAELTKATSAWMPFALVALATGALAIYETRAPYGSIGPQALRRNVGSVEST